MPLLVHRHVQCLAHFKLVERLVAHVVGDVTEVEARLARSAAASGRPFSAVDIGRARVQGDLALTGLELLHAYRRIGVDGEDQVVELDPARVPVLLVAGVTDLRVFL